MKKNFFITIFLILFGVVNSYGFCIHNNTYTKIVAVQTSNHLIFAGFSEHLNPGETKCCNWKEFTCNTGGKKDSITTFKVREYYGNGKIICSTIQTTASGDIYVNNGKGRENPNFNCTRGW